MLKILHVTPGLESGGAEMILMKLVSRMDRSRFQNIVVSLTDEGPIIGERLRDMSIHVAAMGFPRRVPNPKLALALARIMREEQPDIIQTWMYHGNAVGSIANVLGLKRPLLWNIHAAVADRRTMSRQTHFVITTGAHLARHFPRSIICCSQAALDDHAAMGYPRDKMTVIQNGIDTAEFIPNAKAREEIRRDLGIRPRTPVVGYVARYDEQKDHRTFFRAAGVLLKRRPDVRFVLCGGEIDPGNKALVALINEAGAQDNTHLLGLVQRPAGVTAALDVATCSSLTESFSLTLGEAMACGVPCVTTNLPGPASLVGDLGRIVPVGDFEAVADAWEQILDLAPEERERLAELSRARIIDNFSMDAMVRQYEEFYETVGRTRTGVPTCAD